ncbi:hypothetical protein G6F22_021464 [Rhizopus arrhizus]|nr:hypothetical protein G6F22_021464 [Rhizopus arrhizus]
MRAATLRWRKVGIVCPTLTRSRPAGARAQQEHHVAERAAPAQRLQQVLLHEGRTAGIPEPLADAGVELDQADRQEAGEDHQRQADVQTPERQFHQAGA